MPRSAVLDKRFSSDDAMGGEETLQFSREGLAADLPNRGMSERYTDQFIGGGGVYQVTYEVQRVF